MPKTWTRRDFLRHSTLASLLAPVAAYWPDVAEAQAAGARRNLVLVFIPNGMDGVNKFVIREGGGWRFGRGFAPYERFRNDLIAFENYGFAQFLEANYVQSSDHVGNGFCMFSGQMPYSTGGAAWGGMAPTIDQIVAWDYLDRGVITNPLRKSLHIKMTGSALYDSQFTQTPADYSLGRTYDTDLLPVTNIESPRQGFQAMFGDFAAMGGSTVERLWALGKSILDVPAAELQAVRSLLPSDGRAVVDEHLHSLRELEQGLAAEASEPPITPPSEPGYIDVRPSNHEQIFAQWVQIIDAAFRLDRTRIATIEFGGIASRFQVPSLGLGYVGSDNDPDNSGSDHHSYTHYDQSKVDLFFEWYANRITGLLDAMKGDGTTARPNVLANSVVMVGTECGQGHWGDDVPVLLFGQGGGYFRTGQLLTYGNDLTQYHKTTGTLLSVCHAMGVERLQRVGHPAAQYQRGPVPELRA